MRGKVVSGGLARRGAQLTIHRWATTIAAELLSGLCQRSLGTLAYQSGLKFGDRRHLLNNELADGTYPAELAQIGTCTHRRVGEHLPS
jgi:hypothetical protein